MKTLDLPLFAGISVVLLGWTWTGYSALSVALVAASLVLAGVNLWSSLALLGPRPTRIFFALGLTLGWLAEQAGATLGWFFGDYTYTEVLGPRLGAVPLVIPFMWFGLTHVGFVMASLILWRRPAPASSAWQSIALAALLAAMLVTAFDLAADPYFVYQLKAWIMKETDGDWFGETVRGFEGWMIVSFAIVALFQALAKPAAVSAPTATDPRVRRAALVPALLYGGLMLFQVAQVQPVALKVVSFFAMGIPALIALHAWWQWTQGTAQVQP